jgi:hypothetical protein
MALTPADELRLLNLAYIQMQTDVRPILPELFRGAAQSLTADASGIIFLPTTVFHVESIVKTSSTQEMLEPMSKELKYLATGWYHDGVHTTADADVGKRKIAIRKDGAAWASLAVTVENLVEFAVLTDLNGTPFPFVQQRYRNMLTELQAFMMHMEGGKETAKEAEKHWNAYQFFLKQLKQQDSLDSRPRFQTIAHSDAG